MARNGLKAVEDAATVDELYDSLSVDGQADWDEIGSMGYTPFKSKVGNLWFARRTGTPDEGKDIGPSESLSVLKTMVHEVHDKALEDDAKPAEGDTVLDTDPSTGNKFLPGMEQTIKAAHKPLAAAILAYDKAKLDRVAATKKETETKQKMDALLKVHEADLLTDNTHNYKYYAVGTVRGILEKEEKYTTRTEHSDGEPAKKKAA